MRRQWSRAVGCLVCLLLLAASAPSAMAAPVLQPGFELQTIASGLTLPVGIAWAPDGRMFIAEKDGVLKVREPGGAVKVVLDMRADVNSYSDRGLLGVAVDRDFSANGYVYLIYAVEPTPLNPDGDGRTISRLDRITVDAQSQVAAGGARTTIVGTYQPPEDAFYCPRPHTNDVDCIPADQYWHTIGTVRVDPGDGTLWFGSGDALAPAEGAAQPIAFRTFDEQTYAGKLVHVDRDGRGVPGHPFCPAEMDLTKVCTKLYAKGFRQPFRFTLRDAEPSITPRTPVLGPVVGDVGWAMREEIDLLRPGRNYGWPCYEGRFQPSPYREAPTCTALYAQGGATEPSLQYHQRDLGGAVTGGPILDRAPYPARYHGQVFYADYSNRWIRSAPVDPSSDSISPADDFRPENFVTDAGGVVDLQADPDGNLVYVDIETGTVRRIVYTTGNRAPVADGAATPDNGGAPLDVAFSSAGSSDPDGDPLTYHWDFGDGTASSSDPNPAHRYEAVGEFDATLTVSDGDRTSTKSFPITTANAAPTATVGAPSTFRAGTAVQLTATASDSQDGELTDDSQFAWQVVLVHHTHKHFISTLTGREASFTARADHDADAHYEVTLNVTDSGGLSDEETVRIDPETVELQLESVPPGAPFHYGDKSGTLPQTLQTAIGYTTTASVDPTFVRDDVTYVFESWSNGMERTSAFTVPATDTELTAGYNGLPTAGFTAEPLAGPSPLDVAFVPASSDPDGDALAHTWDFGDGTMSHDARPTHRYQTPGTYSAVLEISDGRGGHASATRPVVVGVPLAYLPGPGAPLAGMEPVPERAGVALMIGRSGTRASRGGLVRFRLENRDADTAVGVLTVTTGARRPRLLARRVFALPPRAVGSIRIRLSAAERRLLAARGRLRVLVAVRSRIRGAAAVRKSSIRTSLLAPR